jgi:hypothetical protein
MSKPTDVSEAIRAKHPFRQVENRPAKPQKHRYERRKVREIMRTGDWGSDSSE